MRNSLVDKIYQHACKNRKIFLITGDAGFGVLDEFKKRFGRRFLNLGIAEQNMIGFASGLSLAGYKVFVYNIVPFVLYRCFEQVRNDICYQDLPVTLVGIGSGVSYAPGGVTHYSVEDVSLARALPNLVILSPADPQEAQACVEYALKSKSPVYIRIAKNGEPAIHKKKIKSVIEPIVVGGGERVAVLFHGSVSSDVMRAVSGLARKPRVISVPMLQPLNFAALKASLKGIGTIITVEEHFLEGGLGSIIAEWIVRDRLNFRLKKLGIKNEFIHAIRDNPGMRQLYGISSRQIAAVIRGSF